MEKMWYYSDNGTDRKGPVSDSELRQLPLPPSTLVWTEGMANWAPLSSISAPAAEAAAPARLDMPTPAEGKASPLRLATPTPATLTMPAPAAGGSAPPADLSGWMTFVGIMNIIGGVFACLSCIGLIYGIPMIMGGTALLNAKDSIAGMTSVDPGTAAFLEKLQKAFKLTGWAFILQILYVVISVFISIIFFAAISAKLHQVLSALQK